MVSNNITKKDLLYMYLKLILFTAVRFINVLLSLRNKHYTN
jgi:hypothetical protein